MLDAALNDDANEDIAGNKTGPTFLRKEDAPAPRLTPAISCYCAQYVFGHCVVNKLQLMVSCCIGAGWMF